MKARAFEPARLLLTALPIAAAALVWAGSARANDLSSGQMDAAARVFTGTAQCDQGQQVSLTPLAGKPGYFTLEYKKARYTVAPEETQTGAVRLEDKKAGLVWIQIPAKSMLMNAKIGQRMADGCKHREQG